MRRLVLCLTAGAVFGLAACGSDAAVAPAPSTAPADATSTRPPTSGPDIPAGDVSGPALTLAMCGAEGDLVTGADGPYTVETWACDVDGSEVTVDLYGSPAEQATGLQVTLGFLDAYNGNGDVDDVPLLCGDGWVVGFDDVAQAPSIEASLTAAGFPPTGC